MTRFVVIFEGRNGSSQLVSLLNSHPAVLCYPEILVTLPQKQQHEVMTLVAEQQDVRGINVYAGDDRYHVGGFKAKWQTRPFQATGLKAKVTDLAHIPNAMMALQHHGFRLIYLGRNNILKSVISGMNAARLQQQYDGISNPQHIAQVMGSITVDMAEFEYRLARRRLAESLHGWFYDAYPLPKMRLSYEDLLADRSEAIGRICDFIGVERREVSGTFLKNTPPLLSKAVVNFDEFAARFRNTDLACFLD